MGSWMRVLIWVPQGSFGRVPSEVQRRMCGFLWVVSFWSWVMVFCGFFMMKGRMANSAVKRVVISVRAFMERSGWSSPWVAM